MARSPLISPDELHEALLDRTEGAERLVVCDVRWYLDDHERGRREYDAAHVPGAVFVDLHHDLAAVDAGGGRHPLPTTAAFVERLGGWGVGDATPVVAYDAAGGPTASRLWWMLRSIGHDDVRVLDGGYAAWVATGLPVTHELPARAPATHRDPGAWSGVVDADGVVAAMASGRTVVDARAAARYRGDVEPIDARAGHVPGAVNRPHLDALGPDGRHRSPDELRRGFGDLGTAPVVYCGSGVTACHDLLAMHVAGIDDGVLYAGSWSDWSSQPDRPVATGDGA